MRRSLKKYSNRAVSLVETSMALGLFGFTTLVILVLTSTGLRTTADARADFGLLAAIANAEMLYRHASEWSGEQSPSLPAAAYDQDGRFLGFVDDPDAPMPLATVLATIQTLPEDPALTVMESAMLTFVGKNHETLHLQRVTRLKQRKSALP